MQGIREFMCLIGADTFWGYLLLALLIVWAVAECLYPWRPRWKSKTTKDKNGDEVTIHYQIKK